MASAIEQLVASAKEHEDDFEGPRAQIPSIHVALVTCMDSRIDTFRIFGLDSGEAHILRNAGGLITDDMLRSLMTSSPAPPANARNRPDAPHQLRSAQLG